MCGKGVDCPAETVQEFPYTQARSIFPTTIPTDETVDKPVRFHEQLSHTCGDAKAAPKCLDTRQGSGFWLLLSLGLSKPPLHA